MIGAGLGLAAIGLGVLTQVGGAPNADLAILAALPGAGALELLGFDPELGGVDAELAGRFPGQRRRLLGIGNAGEDERHARVGSGAAAGRRQVLLAERPLKDEVQDAPGGVQA